MSIWRHADRIHPVPEHARISLGEGDTPLVRSRSVGPKVGLANLFFKLESCNPTGSYKDRFAAVAVSDMLARGTQRCVATSSGNAGAALAAYTAAARIPCVIAILAGAPAGKLTQMIAYGARPIRIREFGIDAAVTNAVFDTLTDVTRDGSAALQISAYKYCPIGMSGVETLSFELAEQAAKVGLAVDHVFVPAGGGGLTLAVARGFEKLAGSGDLPRRARIEVVQPKGNDTIVSPLCSGAERAVPVSGATRVSGMQVPSVLDGDHVISACRASGGSGYLIDDDEAWAAQRMLAREEGIFSEPAGAVALAGAHAAARAGRIAPDAMVVCLVTGTGFKDIASIETMNAGATADLIDASELRSRL
jgi:threonine synthase